MRTPVSRVLSSLGACILVIATCADGATLIVRFTGTTLAVHDSSNGKESLTILCPRSDGMPRLALNQVGGIDQVIPAHFAMLEFPMDEVDQGATRQIDMVVDSKTKTRPRALGYWLLNKEDLTIEKSSSAAGLSLKLPNIVRVDEILDAAEYKFDKALTSSPSAQEVGARLRLADGDVQSVIDPEDPKRKFPKGTGFGAVRPLSQEIKAEWTLEAGKDSVTIRSTGLAADSPKRDPLVLHAGKAGVIEMSLVDAPLTDVLIGMKWVEAKADTHFEEYYKLVRITSPKLATRPPIPWVDLRYHGSGDCPPMFLDLVTKGKPPR
jgi:hypothetical protein